MHVAKLIAYNNDVSDGVVMIVIIIFDTDGNGCG